MQFRRSLLLFAAFVVLVYLVIFLSYYQPLGDDSRALETYQAQVQRARQQAYDELHTMYNRRTPVAATESQICAHYKTILLELLKNLKESESKLQLQLNNPQYSLPSSPPSALNDAGQSYLPAPDLTTPSLIVSSPSPSLPAGSPPAPSDTALTPPPPPSAANPTSFPPPPLASILQNTTTDNTNDDDGKTDVLIRPEISADNAENPSHLKPPPHLKLFIGILSYHDRVGRRMAIRNTWVKLLDGDPRQEYVVC